MFPLEKNHDKFLSPSFSSTLLDQIYRSMEGDETTSFTKQTDRKHNRNAVVVKQTDNRKSRDDAALFFSSNSISSDSSSSSSSGGFSSSDTDSSFSRASCFAPPKQVRTSASFRFDDLRREAKPSAENRGGEEALLIKNKSRALRIYNNLKKVKQPISPGGKLTSFLNSLFATNEKNKKKSENVNNSDIVEENVKNKKKKSEIVNNSVVVEERKVKFSQEAATCSSARSCLTKTTPYGRNKTVRFCQVEEKENRVVKETARKFLEEYHKKKNDLVLKELGCFNKKEQEEYCDDDVASCASSDLFELDHLEVFESARYCEELPVYETTRVNIRKF